MREFTPGQDDRSEAEASRRGVVGEGVACLLVALLLAVSCSTVPSIPPTSDAPATPEPLPGRVHALAFSTDGGTLFYAFGSDGCELRALTIDGRANRAIGELGFCPERLTTFEDGSVLAASDDSSAWLSADGSRLFEGRTILAALDRDRLLERTADGLLWRVGETTVSLDVDRIGSPRLASDGTLLAIERVEGGERLVRFDGTGPTAITPTFGAIDSWDVAPRADEIVFSARVESGFDVGLVTPTGGEISWVAPDPSDETTVTWAPRGNKITYTFESLDATLVRSVHVPTSFQVIFDLPVTVVRRVAWEPRAERFAIVVESPVHGSRIDWVGYQGETRGTLVEPVERLESPVEALLWEGGSGLLLGPETVRYGESRATVVWVVSGDRFGWRPEVSRLRSNGVPVLVTTPERIGSLRMALDELAWFREDRCYVVDLTGEVSNVSESLTAATWITVDAVTTPRGAEVIRAADAPGRHKAVTRILELEGKGR